MMKLSEAAKSKAGTGLGLQAPSGTGDEAAAALSRAV